MIARAPRRVRRAARVRPRDVVEQGRGGARAGGLASRPLRRGAPGRRLDALLSRAMAREWREGPPGRRRRLSRVPARQADPGGAPAALGIACSRRAPRERTRREAADAASRAPRAPPGRRRGAPGLSRACSPTARMRTTATKASRALARDPPEASRGSADALRARPRARIWARTTRPPAPRRSRDLRRVPRTDAGRSLRSCSSARASASWAGQTEGAVSDYETYLQGTPARRRGAPRARARSWRIRSARCRSSPTT